MLLARAIDVEHRRVSRAYFLRADLLFPKEAPYWKVLQANTEGGYWQLVRTNKPTFDLICSKWNSDRVLWRDGLMEDGAGGVMPRRGRPNMLDARGVCALTLAWLGSTGPNNRLLEQIFGVGHSVTDRDIEEGLDMLIEALQQIPEAVVQWPSRRKMLEYAAMIRDACGENPYEPHVHFFCFTDNNRSPTVAAPDGEPDVDYNGWVHGHTKNTNLVFTPDGKIIHMSIGHTGSTHDYTTAATFFEKMNNRAWTPLGMCVLADNAFSSRQTWGFVGDRYNFRPPAAALSPIPAERQRQQTAYRRLHRKARNSVEHGIRTLTAVWARLKTVMPRDGRLLKKVYTAAAMMHNLNASFVPGSNQMATMYLEAHLRP
jgi:hypothetical protein